MAQQKQYEYECPIHPGKMLPLVPAEENPDLLVGICQCDPTSRWYGQRVVETGVKALSKAAKAPEPKATEKGEE